MAQKSHTEQDRPRDPLVACRVARCWQWRLLRRFTSAKGRVWVKGITVLTCFELSRSGVESPWDGSGFWGRCAFVCVGCCRIAESGRSRRHESRLRRLRIRVARVAVSRGTGVGAGDGGRGVGFCPRQGSPFISGVGFGSPSPSRQWTPKYHGARRGPWSVDEGAKKPGPELAGDAGRRETAEAKRNSKLHRSGTPPAHMFQFAVCVGGGVVTRLTHYSHETQHAGRYFDEGVEREAYRPSQRTHM